MSEMSVVPYQTKKKCLTQSAVDTYNEIIPPVDYSFTGMENIEDAKEEEPRLPISPRGKGKHIEPVKGGKSSGRCLKMNNNSLTHIESLAGFASVKFTNWEDLAWIDLSQNELTKIGSELTEFVNLQILYLHGNQINDVNQVDQLIPLKNLRKLTLHGNPIDHIKGYRWLVLSKLPQLQSLDFNCVTKAEKKTTHTWDKMNCWGPKKKKKIIEED